MIDKVGSGRHSASVDAAGERPFHVGEWFVDPAAGTITRGAATRHLEPRVMQVLVALASRAGEVVSRERLLASVWSETVVNDEALSRCIAALRKAFSDRRNRPLAIETIPKKGYRLLQRVRSCAQAAAVLPFINLTGEERHDVLAAGMAELLTTEFARVCSLRVISSSSAARFERGRTALRDFAAETGIDIVVEGALVPRGEKMGLTVQLIDAATDRHLWAQTYERSFEELAALQHDVACRLAAELQPTRGPAVARPVSRVQPRAFETYLKGRHFWSRRDPASLKTADSLFREAIVADPGFAPAHVGLADTHVLLALYGITPPEVARRAASLALNAALALDPESPDAQVCQCAIGLFFEWRFGEAKRCLQAVVDDHRSLPLAFLALADAFAMTGSRNRALHSIQTAVDLDPYDPGLNMNLAGFLFMAGHRDAALEQYRRTVSINPGFLPALYRLGTTLALEGRSAEASTVLSELPLDGAPTDVVVGRIVIACLVGAEGEARRGRAELQRNALREYLSPTREAVVHAAFGDHVEALVCVRRALEIHDPLLTLLNSDTVLAPLRSVPGLFPTLRAHGMEESIDSCPA